MAHASRQPRSLLPKAWGNRLQARLIGLRRPRTVLQAEPEPRLIGSAARGQQLLSGQIHLAGHLVEGLNPWTLGRAAPDDPAFNAALHGFIWLDDLAALATRPAQIAMRDWTLGWIARYGRGGGPGWTPELAGRRLLRWVSHVAPLVPDGRAAEHFTRSLGRHTLFLARRWPAAPQGLPRIEALTALIYGALALEGMENHAAVALAALGRACDVIDDDGGLPSRNPEELLEVFYLLLLAASALSEANYEPADAHLAAIGRIAPVLRALRHADGGLVRMHGGGRGAEGRLDQALSAAGVRARTEGLAMGYLRLSGGRSTVIIDAAPPPVGVHAAHAHASALAFELTSGRRPVIVSIGSGEGFGGDWRRAGRATPSHSVLGLEGVSSARLGPMNGGVEYLTDGPREVSLQQETADDTRTVTLSHDGWRRTHGLIHVRQLSLSRDGRILNGEDALGAATAADRAAFTEALRRTGREGLRYSIRFHLHPDVSAEIDAGGMAVILSLRGGERWIFCHDGEGVMALQPSVYLDKRRLAPRPTRQIVLSATIAADESQIGWTLAKAQDRPPHIRDLEPDELLADA